MNQDWSATRAGKSRFDFDAVVDRSRSHSLATLRDMKLPQTRDGQLSAAQRGPG